MTKKKSEAAADPSSIGSVAKIFEDVPTETINLAVFKQQENPGAKLGEILVDLKAMSPGALKRCLTRQDAIRAGKPSSKDVIAMLEYAAKMASRDATNLEEMAELAKKK
jgi:hypothetical protein